MAVSNSTDTGVPASAVWAKKLLPVAVIIGVFAAFFLLGGPEYVTLDSLKKHRQILLDWAADNYLLVVLIYMAAYSVMVAASIPGALVLTLAGGFLFGTIEAMIYVVFSATLGATVIFLIAR